MLAPDVSPRLSPNLDDAPKGRNCHGLGGSSGAGVSSGKFPAQAKLGTLDNR